LTFGLPALNVGYDLSFSSPGTIKNLLFWPPVNGAGDASKPNSYPAKSYTSQKTVAQMAASSNLQADIQSAYTDLPTAWSSGIPCKFDIVLSSKLGMTLTSPMQINITCDNTKAILETTSFNLTGIYLPNKTYSFPCTIKMTTPETLVSTIKLTLKSGQVTLGELDMLVVPIDLHLESDMDLSFDENNIGATKSFQGILKITTKYDVDHTDIVGGIDNQIISFDTKSQDGTEYTYNCSGQITTPAHVDDNIDPINQTSYTTKIFNVQFPLFNIAFAMNFKYTPSVITLTPNFSNAITVVGSVATGLNTKSIHIPYKSSVPLPANSLELATTSWASTNNLNIDKTKMTITHTKGTEGVLVISFLENAATLKAATTYTFTSLPLSYKWNGCNLTPKLTFTNSNMVEIHVPDAGFMITNNTITCSTPLESTLNYSINIVGETKDENQKQVQQKAGIKFTVTDITGDGYTMTIPNGTITMSDNNNTQLTILVGRKAEDACFKTTRVFQGTCMVMNGTEPAGTDKPCSFKIVFPEIKYDFKMSISSSDTRKTWNDIQTSTLKLAITNNLTKYTIPPKIYEAFTLSYCTNNKVCIMPLNPSTSFENLAPSASASYDLKLTNINLPGYKTNLSNITFGILVGSVNYKDVANVKHEDITTMVLYNTDNTFKIYSLLDPDSAGSTDEINVTASSTTKFALHYTGDVKTFDFANITKVEIIKVDSTDMGGSISGITVNTSDASIVFTTKTAFAANDEMYVNICAGTSYIPIKITIKAIISGAISINYDIANDSTNAYSFANNNLTINKYNQWLSVNSKQIHVTTVPITSIKVMANNTLINIADNAIRYHPGFTSTDLGDSFVVKNDTTFNVNYPYCTGNYNAYFDCALPSLDIANASVGVIIPKRLTITMNVDNTLFAYNTTTKKLNSVICFSTSGNVDANSLKYTIDDTSGKSVWSNTHPNSIMASNNNIDCVFSDIISLDTLPAGPLSVTFKHDDEDVVVTNASSTFKVSPNSYRAEIIFIDAPVVANMVVHTDAGPSRSIDPYLGARACMLFLVRFGYGYNFKIHGQLTIMGDGKSLVFAFDEYTSTGTFCNIADGTGPYSMRMFCIYFSYSQAKKINDLLDNAKTTKMVKLIYYDPDPQVEMTDNHLTSEYEIKNWKIVLNDSMTIPSNPPSILAAAQIWKQYWPTINSCGDWEVSEYPVQTGHTGDTIDTLKPIDPKTCGTLVPSDLLDPSWTGDNLNDHTCVQMCVGNTDFKSCRSMIQPDHILVDNYNIPKDSQGYKVGVSDIPTPDYKLKMTTYPSLDGMLRVDTIGFKLVDAIKDDANGYAYSPAKGFFVVHASTIRWYKFSTDTPDGPYQYIGHGQPHCDPKSFCHGVVGPLTAREVAQ